MGELNHNGVEWGGLICACCHPVIPAVTLFSPLSPCSPPCHPIIPMPPCHPVIPFVTPSFPSSPRPPLVIPFPPHHPIIPSSSHPPSAHRPPLITPSSLLTLTSTYRPVLSSSPCPPLATLSSSTPSIITPSSPHHPILPFVANRPLVTLSSLLSDPSPNPPVMITLLAPSPPRHPPRPQTRRPAPASRVWTTRTRTG